MNNASRVGFFRSSGNDSAVRIERIKIAFQFLLMAVCSAVMGILLSRALPESFYMSSVLRISSHFEMLFINCSRFYDYIRCIVIYALSDIICVSIIFGVSFAAFNYVASDLVLVYGGIKTGFAVSFLSAFISDARFAYNIGYLKYFVFVFFKVLLFVLVFDYSYRAAVYSRKLKQTGPTGRPNVKMRVLFPFIINTLAYVGSVIILNGAYCWLIYVLK